MASPWERPPWPLSRREETLYHHHFRPHPPRAQPGHPAPMLAQLRQGNPEIRVTLLVATGFHRLTTTAELEAKLGKEIAGSEKIVVHDAL